MTTLSVVALVCPNPQGTGAQTLDKHCWHSEFGSCHLLHLDARQERAQSNAKCRLLITQFILGMANALPASCTDWTHAQA